MQTAISIIVGLAIYVYFAYSLMVIADKTRTPHSWFAFIPILSTYLMIKIAGRPGWWLILMFIPLVNIVISLIVLWGLAEARGFSGWLGILLIIPVLDLILIGYLAFAESHHAPIGPPLQHH